jgi:small subunit ribosomal protein S13
MTEQKQADDFKYIVRIAQADLDGNKQVLQALTKIKGVSIMYSNMVCNFAKVSKTVKLGNISDSDIKKLNDVLENKDNYKIPDWMLNRRKDYESGDNLHVVSSDLQFALDNDLKRLKKMKSYKGVRHMFGLPVRGQRTKSNFRKNKGSVMGVKRKPGKSGRV